MTNRRDLRFAAAALTFYAIHAGYHAARGHWEDALWACHLANLVIAAGFLFDVPRALGVGFMWTLIGNAMWVLYLVEGGELMPTSLLTHVGGLVLAFIGRSRQGIPRGTWQVATMGLVATQALARLVTPPEANVNVAWRAFGNWDEVVPSYPLYLTLVDTAAATLFWITERGWRAVRPHAGE